MRTSDRSGFAGNYSPLPARTSSCAAATIMTRLVGAFERLQRAFILALHLNHIQQLTGFDRLMTKPEPVSRSTSLLRLGVWPTSVSVGRLAFVGQGRFEG